MELLRCRLAATAASGPAIGTTVSCLPMAAGDVLDRGDPGTSLQLVMATYKVTVATGDMVEAGTNNSISITLVGSYGESRQTTISFLFLPGKVGMGIGTKGTRGAPSLLVYLVAPQAICPFPQKPFPPLQEKSLSVHCGQDLGPIVLIRLHKWRLFLEDAWFCKDVRVTAPNGTLYRFPCYQWLEGVTTVEVREGSGKKLVDDKLQILKEHRHRELAARQEAYRWKNFAQGWPRCLNVDSIFELDSNIQFSRIRANNFTGFLIFQGASHFLSGFLLRRSSWNSLDEMRTIFSRTQGRDIVTIALVPEYVAKHWQEDDFFGSQFLNGNNPIIIHRCTTLPLKFPVTPEMVAGSLGGGTDLGKELQEGRIFIVDYKVLEDIPTDTIYGRQQYIAAPLCLLHQGTDGLLRPIAIQVGVSHSKSCYEEGGNGSIPPCDLPQLSQTPGPHSPIFLPSDDEWDWLLAKTWVRNADFYSHQLLTHLLRTHLFGEVFAIATLRHLPTCHPLFKLLMPHFHFTLHINTLARTVLINQGGLIDKTLENMVWSLAPSALPNHGWPFSQGSGVTYEGLLLVVERGLEQVTYTSLCLPDDIRHRGMSHVPNYHYRDDGMSLWEAIESFVTGIVTFYYDGDAAVSGDTELQAWVMDIFTNGFLGRTSSGIPSSLQTVVELIKFLTMVMFTCSAQHAAVNNGQYDLGAFVPNAPSSMRHPPPSKKGRAFLQHFLDTIPEVATTANILVALILLSSQLKDRVSLAPQSPCAPSNSSVGLGNCKRCPQGWMSPPLVSPSLGDTHHCSTPTRVPENPQIAPRGSRVPDAVSLQRLLGQYPEEWFTEAEPRRLIRAFQGRLEEIRDRIEERNHLAELRYNYLNPLETENSISI
ncbi:LOW QUALITY PROTEIN: polyunsaturated fatty acid lipoxygenase ALOX15B-like [Geothlypis trichas]